MCKPVNDVGSIAWKRGKNDPTNLVSQDRCQQEESQSCEEPFMPGPDSSMNAQGNGQHQNGRQQE